LITESVTTSTSCLVCEQDTGKKQWINALLQEPDTNIVPPCRSQVVKPGYVNGTGRAVVHAGLCTPMVVTWSVVETPPVLIRRLFLITLRMSSSATTVRARSWRPQSAAFIWNVPLARSRWSTARNVGRLCLRRFGNLLAHNRSPTASPCLHIPVCVVHVAGYYFESLSFTSTSWMRYTSPPNIRISILPSFHAVD
jgi:hypothetical protein